MSFLVHFISTRCCVSWAAQRLGLSFGFTLSPRRSKQFNGSDTSSLTAGLSKAALRIDGICTCVCRHASMYA